MFLFANALTGCTLNVPPPIEFASDVQHQTTDMTTSDQGDLDAGAVLDGSRPDGSAIPIDGSIADAVMPADWYDSRWRRRTKVRLLAYSLMNPVDDIIVQLRLNNLEEIFGPQDTNRFDNNDIVFVDGDGLVVHHDHDTWTRNSGIVWLRFDRIEPRRVDQYVWLYWDYNSDSNSEPTQPDNIWADHYNLVLKMDQRGDNLLDAVANQAIEAIETGDVQHLNTAQGVISRFDGQSTYSLPLSALVGTDPFTFTASFKDNGTEASTASVLRLTSDRSLPSELLVGANDSQEILLRQTVNLFGPQVLEYGEHSSTGGMQHLAITYTPGGRLSYSLNGEPTITHNQQSPPVSFDTMILGSEYQGDIDNIRISKTAHNIENHRVEQMFLIDNLFELGERPFHPPAPGLSGSRVPDAALEFDFDRIDQGSITSITPSQEIEIVMDIEDANKVSDIGGGIRLNEATLIKSARLPWEFVTRCIDTGELTVEVWVTMESLRFRGPARIFTLSLDTTTRLFTLGQGGHSVGQASGSEIVFRLSHSDTDTNGTNHNRRGAVPIKLQLSPSALTVPQHIVFTFTGDLVIGYLNGAAVVSAPWEGELNGWAEQLDSSINMGQGYRLAIGNEVSANRNNEQQQRPWLGSIYHAAAYCRALTPAAIQQNFNAGY